MKSPERTTMTGSTNKTILIIPHYNALNDLYRSVKSIGKDENIDLLIIDDGSELIPDEEYLREIFSSNGVLSLVNLKQNVGITAALNYGVKYAKDKGYKYIGRLDAGDIVLGPRFSLQEEFLDKNEDYAVVGSWVDFVDTKGHKLFTLKHPIEDKDIKKAIYRYNPFVHPATMIRVESFGIKNLYPNCYPALEDWALFLELSKSWKMYNIPKILLEYEVSENSISTQKRLLQSKSKVKLLMNNYRPNINQTIGLVKNIIILFFPRAILTKVKEIIK
ncbi:glycosyltransferase [Ferrimonas balearica]|uniref:glycosyltransferase n=1 Tax=Ferrimonas balearica TaxID=44012 RepID=UPI001C95E5D2|nr:glycosyltransferase [Ferrimonas balearica]